MDHVISGVAKFQKEVYPNKKAKFQKLATGQNPEVLFITCSDSRIDPNLVTQTDPVMRATSYLLTATKLVA